MGSLHKVGDIVTIKSEYDNGYTSNDYPCSFNENMLDKYGGKKMKIKSVYEIPNHFHKAKLHTENYYYILYDDHWGCLWTDPMFEEREL